MKTLAGTARAVSQTRARIAAQCTASPLLVFPGGTPLKTLQNASGLLSRTWNWIRERQAARSNPKRLHVASTVSLGEKRFVAVVHVDGREFLVGGGAANVALLAQLKGNESFGTVLQDTMTPPKKQPVKRVRPQAVKPAAKRMGAGA